MVIQRYIYFAITVLFVACDTVDLKGFLVPTSDSTDKRVTSSLAWNNSHAIPNLVVGSDEYGFEVLTDTHIEKDNKTLKQAIAYCRNRTETSFILMLGDLANEVGSMELVADAIIFDPATELYNDTVFTITGNHDLFFNDWVSYKKLFGTSTFYFTVSTPNNTDLYIGLDSGNGTFGKKQLNWLEKLLKTSRRDYRNCIVFTHTNIFKTDKSQDLSGNFSIEETYRILNIFATYNVNLVLQGHDHFYESLEYRNVQYVIANALERDKDGKLFGMEVICNNLGTSHKLQTLEN